MTGKKNVDGSLLSVAQDGDRLKTLERLRDEICDCIDQTVSVREIAPLSRQLITVLEQIDGLDGGKSKKRKDAEVTPIEVLFNKQPKRRKTASG